VEKAPQKNTRHKRQRNAKTKTHKESQQRKLQATT